MTAGLTPEAQVDRAWRFVYSRPATADERKEALEFLERQSVSCAEDAARRRWPICATCS